MTGPHAATLATMLRAQQQEAKIARQNREADREQLHRMLAVIIGGHTLQPYPEGIRP